MNEEELKDFLRILSDPTQRFSHDQKGIAWDQVIASYRALAARVQAVEEVNRIAAIKATVGDTEYSLRQQLAEAQGTIAKKDTIIKQLIADDCEMEEQFVKAGFSDYDAHGDYKGLPTQIEEALKVLAESKQDAARLREALEAHMQLAAKICYAEPELSQYRAMTEQAQQALKGEPHAPFRLTS